MASDAQKQKRSASDRLNDALSDLSKTYGDHAPTLEDVLRKAAVSRATAFRDKAFMKRLRQLERPVVAAAGSEEPKNLKRGRDRNEIVKLMANEIQRLSLVVERQRHMLHAQTQQRHDNVVLPTIWNPAGRRPAGKG